jgi:hypothetical protein
VADDPQTTDQKERVIVYSVAALISCVIILTKLLLTEWKTLPDGVPFGADFVSFWSAGKLAAIDVTRVYDITTQATIFPGYFAPFFYPPTFLLICAPLGLFSYYGALGIFMGVTCGLYVLAASRVAPWACIAALGFPVVATNLIVGQNAMLTAAIIGAGLTLMDRKPRAAGMILGAMVIKPHLAILIPVFLLLSGRWVVLGYAAGSGLALIGTSGLIFGWDVWVSFFVTGSNTAFYVLQSASTSADMKFQSVFGVARLLGAGSGLAYAAQAIVAASAIAVALRFRRSVSSLAIERSLVVVIGLLTTPYLMHYDVLILVFPCLWIASEWIESGRIPIPDGITVFFIFISPIAFVFLGSPPGFYLLVLVGLLGFLIFRLDPARTGVEAKKKASPRRMTPLST